MLFNKSAVSVTVSAKSAEVGENAIASASVVIAEEGKEEWHNCFSRVGWQGFQNSSKGNSNCLEVTLAISTNNNLRIIIISCSDVIWLK